MFDLDAFDKEVSSRFRETERTLSLAYLKNQSSKAITVIVVGTVFLVSALVLANTNVLNAAEPIAMTSDMTYNGMTIEDFAVEMGISIYDPYLLVIFEDLCMTEIS